MQQTRVAMAVTRRVVALFDGVLLTESERSTVDEVCPLVLAVIEDSERLRRREETRRTPINTKPGSAQRYSER